jgi:hypothetical protein
MDGCISGVHVAQSFSLLCDVLSTIVSLSVSSPLVCIGFPVAQSLVFCVFITRLVSSNFLFVTVCCVMFCRPLLVFLSFWCYFLHCVYFVLRLLITLLVSSNFYFYSGKIWSARLTFLFFGSGFEYIHCNKYQNFNKFQPTDYLQIFIFISTNKWEYKR